MKNQNKEIAETCLQNIVNCSDIVSDNEDHEIIIGIIEATVKGIRIKQHEATKSRVMEIHNEWNGLDEEVLETIAIPDVEF